MFLGFRCFGLLLRPCLAGLPDDRRYWYLASLTPTAALTRRKKLRNMCLSGLDSRFFLAPAMSLPRQLTRRPEILVPCISHSSGSSAYSKEESCPWAWHGVALSKHVSCALSKHYSRRDSFLRVLDLGPELLFQGFLPTWTTLASCNCRLRSRSFRLVADAGGTRGNDLCLALELGQSGLPYFFEQALLPSK